MEKIPAYKKVAQEIESRICSGTYVEKQKLPSEYDLADEFDVSRLTVRKAIDSLIDRNMLFKRTGKGTYVMKPSEKVQSGKEGLVGFTESARLYGKSSQTSVLLFEETASIPETVLQAMQMKEGDELYLVKRLRCFDDDPMTIENLFVQKKLLKGLSKNQLEGSLFSLIEETVDIAYSHQEVEAILATGEMAQLLKVKKNAPILKVISITYSANAIPLIYDTSYYRGDKYTFKNTLVRKH